MQPQVLHSVPARHPLTVVGGLQQQQGLLGVKQRLQQQLHPHMTLVHLHAACAEVLQQSDAASR